MHLVGWSEHSEEDDLGGRVRENERDPNRERVELSAKRNES